MAIDIIFNNNELMHVDTDFDHKDTKIKDGFIRIGKDLSINAGFVKYILNCNVHKDDHKENDIPCFVG